MIRNAISFELENIFTIEKWCVVANRKMTVSNSILKLKIFNFCFGNLALDDLKSIVFINHQNLMIRLHNLFVVFN